MQKSSLPPVLLSVFIGMTITVLVSFLLTFITKVSVHAAGISGILGAIIALYVKFLANYQLEITALVLLWGLIAFSRLQLKSHNQVQILLGTLVGFVSVFVTTLIGFTI